MLVAELLTGERKLPDVLETVGRRLLDVLVLGPDEAEEMGHDSRLVHGHAVPRILTTDFHSMVSRPTNITQERHSSQLSLLQIKPHSKLGDLLL